MCKASIKMTCLVCRIRPEVIYEEAWWQLALWGLEGLVSMFAERVSGNFDELKQLCSRARVISWPREEKINFQVGHNFVWLYNGMHLMVVHEWY